MSYTDLPTELWEKILLAADVYSATNFSITCKDTYEQYYPLLKESIAKNWIERKEKVSDLAWSYIKERAQKSPDLDWGLCIDIKWAPYFISTVPKHGKRIIVTSDLIYQWMKWIRHKFNSPSGVNQLLAYFLQLGNYYVTNYYTETDSLVDWFLEEHTISSILFPLSTEVTSKPILIAIEYYKFVYDAWIFQHADWLDDIVKRIKKMDPDGSIRQALWQM